MTYTQGQAEFFVALKRPTKTGSGAFVGVTLIFQWMGVFALLLHVIFVVYVVLSWYDTAEKFAVKSKMQRSTRTLLVYSFHAPGELCGPVAFRPRRVLNNIRTTREILNLLRPQCEGKL